MLRAALSFLSILTALLIFYSGPSIAQDNPTINIKTNPKLSEANAKYKDVLKTLNQQQQDFLKKLDKINIKTNEPLFTLSKQGKIFNACTKIDTDITDTHAKMLQTLKLVQLDKLKAGQKIIRDLMTQAGFIDRKTLQGHLAYDTDLQTQLLDGMADLMASTITENKEGKGSKLCNELKQELESEYSTPYAVPAANPASVDMMRDSMTGKIRSCNISTLNTSGNNRISTAILVIDYSDKGINFEFSTKVYTPTGSNLPVENTWIDAGRLNSQFSAKLTKPSQDLLIGNIPLGYVVPFLQYIKQYPFVAGAKASGWDHTAAFEVSMETPEEVDKMADCVAALAPSLKEPLEKAGFTITPDKQHEKGKASGIDSEEFLYKTTAMSGNLSNPGACIWQFPAIKKDNAEIQGVMITGGFIKENHIYNNSTVLWLLGHEGPNRLSFTDGEFTTKTPKGDMIKSSEYTQKVIKGQRYEIHMPLSAHLPFINGIYTNGLNISAKAEGMEKPLSQTFKPPRSKAYQVYYNCMKNLFDDLERRKKEP